MNPSATQPSQTATGVTAEDIRDIRGLVEIPSPWAFLAWLGLALAVAAAGLLLVRWLRRPALPPPPPSADTVARAPE